MTSVQEGEDLSTGPFEDEETRALYESLPDIRALVPALLLGTAEGQPAAEEEGAEQPMETEASADTTSADAGAADSRAEATQEATAGSSLHVSCHASRLGSHPQIAATLTIYHAVLKAVLKSSHDGMLCSMPLIVHHGGMEDWWMEVLGKRMVLLFFRRAP